MPKSQKNTTAATIKGPKKLPVAAASAARLVR